MNYENEEASVNQQEGSKGGSACQKDHMELLMVIKGHEVQTIRLQVRKTRPREKRLTQGHITANSRARSEHNPKCFSFIIIWESLL